MLILFFDLIVNGGWSAWQDPTPIVCSATWYVLFQFIHRTIFEYFIFCYFLVALVHDHSELNTLIFEY